MKNNLKSLTQLNVAALYSLSRFFVLNKTWKSENSVELETSETLHEIFSTMAWSDRSLHIREYWILEAIIQEDKSQGGCIEDLLGEVHDSEFPGKRTPTLLQSARAHDQKFGTNYASMAMSHLENLCYLIISSDDELLESEVQSMNSLLDRWRIESRCQPTKMSRSAS